MLVPKAYFNHIYLLFILFFKMKELVDDIFLFHFCNILLKFYIFVFSGAGIGKMGCLANTPKDKRADGVRPEAGIRL
jgi:hypothetical protein